MRKSYRSGIHTPAAGHRVLLASFLCACLLLTGCGSGGVTTVEDNSDEEATIETIVTDIGTEETGAGAAGTGAPAEPAASLLTQTDHAALSATAAAPVSPVREEGSTFSAEGKGLLIVLDPGHSSQIPEGTEPIGPGSSEMKEADTVGTYGPASALHEYELTMRVSQKLRTELEKRGYEVHMTHLDTVQPISCVRRAEIANENAADAFLRIHANGAEDTSAHGAMTICITSSNPYHPELYSASKRLSETVLDSYCEGTGASREKVWETDTMTGNNWAEVPTTLIELGYMTNPDEDLMMAMDSYQKKMVLSIADGLDRWFAEMPASELAMHPSLTGGQRQGGDTETNPGTQTDPAQQDLNNPVEITNDGAADQGSQTQNPGGPVEITDDGSADQNNQAQPAQGVPVEITDDSSSDQNDQTQQVQSGPVEITDDSETEDRGTGSGEDVVEIDQDAPDSGGDGTESDSGSLNRGEDDADTQQDSEDSGNEEENTESLGVPFR